MSEELDLSQPQDALRFINTITLQTQLTRANAARFQHALQTLYQAIQPLPEPEPKDYSEA